MKLRKIIQMKLKQAHVLDTKLQTIFVQYSARRFFMRTLCIFAYTGENTIMMIMMLTKSTTTKIDKHADVGVAACAPFHFSFAPDIGKQAQSAAS